MWCLILFSINKKWNRYNRIWSMTFLLSVENHLENQCGLGTLCNFFLQHTLRIKRFCWRQQVSQKLKEVVSQYPANHPDDQSDLAMKAGIYHPSYNSKKLNNMSDALQKGRRGFFFYKLIILLFKTNNSFIY